MGVFDEQIGAANDFAHACREAGLETFVLPESPWVLVLTVLKLAKLVRRTHIAAICTHDYKSNLAGALVSFIMGVPLVAVFHGRTSHGFKIRLYEWLDDLVLKFCDAIVAVSEDTKRKLKSLGIKDDCIHMIPNGIDSMAYLAERGAHTEDERKGELGGNPLNGTARKILYAGRLSREKGLRVLVEAAKLVLDEAPGVEFVILGEGPERPFLLRRIAQLGLQKRVILPGFVKDISRILNEVKLCVLPSFTEGMPLFLLEACASRKPIVATRVGGVPEIVQDGITGFLVEPGKPMELAAKIKTILADPEKGREMGEAGYRRVAEKYTIQSQAVTFVELFNKVSATRHAETLEHLL